MLRNQKTGEDDSNLTKNNKSRQKVRKKVKENSLGQVQQNFNNININNNTFIIQTCENQGCKHNKQFPHMLPQQQQNYINMPFINNNNHFNIFNNFNFTSEQLNDYEPLKKEEEDNSSVKREKRKIKCNRFYDNDYQSFNIIKEQQNRQKLVEKQQHQYHQQMLYQQQQQQLQQKMLEQQQELQGSKKRKSKKKKNIVKINIKQDDDKLCLSQHLCNNEHLEDPNDKKQNKNNIKSKKNNTETEEECLDKQQPPLQNSTHLDQSIQNLLTFNNKSNNITPMNQKVEQCQVFNHQRQSLFSTFMDMNINLAKPTLNKLYSPIISASNKRLQLHFTNHPNHINSNKHLQTPSHFYDPSQITSINMNNYPNQSIQEYLNYDFIHNNNHINSNTHHSYTFNQQHQFTPHYTTDPHENTEKFDIIVEQIKSNIHKNTITNVNTNNINNNNDNNINNNHSINDNNNNNDDKKGNNNTISNNNQFSNMNQNQLDIDILELNDEFINQN